MPHTIQYGSHGSAVQPSLKKDQNQILVVHSAHGQIEAACCLKFNNKYRYRDSPYFISEICEWENVIIPL